jgi:hypothetical protein
MCRHLWHEFIVMDRTWISRCLGCDETTAGLWDEAPMSDHIGASDQGPDSPPQGQS